MTGQILGMLLAVVGGLGIFMLGMKFMSEGMQAVAGNSLRRMISLVTDKPVLAAATGTAVTILVQSSTVTTVIVVGFANAGVMLLHQAVGVIIGANIGTTITGWILVLQIGKYGLPLLGAAALVYLFTRRDRPRFIAMALMGMGMVFFGLEAMKNGFAPMKDMPAFTEAFAWFGADSYAGMYKAVLVGCILTLIVQSSSATLGITIGLAVTGAIPYTTAAALVLGENLGTTITVVLASIGANTNAKRAAAAHVGFNLIGVTWITTIFFWYTRLIAGVMERMHDTNPITMTMASAGAEEYAAVITAAIALTHTGFNVANAIVFLPFVHLYARLLERVIPDPAVKEKAARLRHLHALGVNSPVLELEQSRGQVVQMGESVIAMAGAIRRLAYDDGGWDERLAQQTHQREEHLDDVQRDVVSFLSDALDATVPHAVAQEGRQQLRIAHELESTSDRLSGVLKSMERLRERKLVLSPAQRDGLRELHDAVEAFMRRVIEAYATQRPVDDAEARTTSRVIHQMVRDRQEEHMQMMIDGAVDPHLTMIYTAALTDYRRIRAHAVNVHDATAGSVAAAD